jgi:hypothetical protein
VFSPVDILESLHTQWAAMKIILWPLVPMICGGRTVPYSPDASFPVSRCQYDIVSECLLVGTIAGLMWCVTYANMALWKIFWPKVSLICFVVGCCQLVLVSVYSAMSTPISYFVVRLLVKDDVLMPLVFL